MSEWDGLTAEQVQAVKKVRERVIDTIGKNMDLYGITSSIGHLYGYMYFSNEPMTLDGLSGAMGMSKTSMSTGVRTLLDLKMIDKVWGKGSRKDLYEVTPDWHQNFTDYFAIKWRKAVEANMNALTRSMKEIGELRAREPDNEALRRLLDIDEGKIEEAIKYYKWLVRLIDTLESGAIYDFIPKEE